MKLESTDVYPISLVRHLLLSNAHIYLARIALLFLCFLENLRCDVLVHYTKLFGTAIKQLVLYDSLV